MAYNEKTKDGKSDAISNLNKPDISSSDGIPKLRIFICPLGHQ
jgi:hypothetical protein